MGHLHVLYPDRTTDAEPEWLIAAHRGFRDEVLDPAYPCSFGRAALKRGELFTTWVDPADPDGFAFDVAEFLDISAAAPQVRQPLAVFVKPGDGVDDEAEMERQFWGLLRYLHEHDELPWPPDVPVDADQEGWQFCFHGTSIFVFALAPTARLRRSRWHSSCMVMVFMPRGVFDGVEVGTDAGNVARAAIRRKLVAWDAVDPHPSMGDSELLSDDEWRQYFISDSNTDRHDRCPFKHDVAAAGRVAAGR